MNLPILLLLLLLAMALAVAAYVVLPLLRRVEPEHQAGGGANADAPRAGADDAAATRIAVLRERRKELEASLAHLPADAPERRQAMAELTAQAAFELDAEGAGTPRRVGERRRPVAAALLASFLVIPFFALYLLAGSPESVSPDFQAMRAGGPTLDEMAAGLRERLRQEPDRADGWQLLGRTELARGRAAEARDALERAAALMPDDPGIKVDLAEAIAQQQGARLDGQPIELIREALAIEPRHQKGLALAGAWYVTQQDYDGAARSWQALLEQLPRGSPQALQIEAFLEDVRAGRGPQFSQRSNGESSPPDAGQAAPLAQSTPPPGQPGQTPGATATAGVRGLVEVAAPLAAALQATDTLFVVARALDADGNAAGPPVAVLTARATELPLSFTLDDSLAMVPTARLSGTERVAVVARISRSGGAFPQPGDLQGVTAPVAADASNVRVLIDSVVQ